MLCSLFYLEFRGLLTVGVNSTGTVVSTGVPVTQLTSHAGGSLLLC